MVKKQMKGNQRDKKLIGIESLRMSFLLPWNDYKQLQHIAELRREPNWAPNLSELVREAITDWITKNSKTNETI